MGFGGGGEGIEELVEEGRGGRVRVRVLVEFGEAEEIELFFVVGFHFDLRGFAAEHSIAAVDC